MANLAVPVDALYSKGDAQHDIGAPANRINNVYAVQFHGDGSNLTGISATPNVDDDYTWTGDHTFNGAVTLTGGITGDVLPTADNTFDLGSGAFRWATITANAFVGDGSGLTGLPAASVDESANYTWTGTHTFAGNNVSITGAALVVPASTSSFQTTAGGIYLDGTTSGPNISERSGTITFRSSTTAEICGLSAGVFAFPANASLQWANNNNYASNAGTKLTPFNAGEGIIEQESHSSNNYAQGWYWNGTKTNSSNYERFVIRTQSSDVTEIGQEESGTGTARTVNAIGDWDFQGNVDCSSLPTSDPTAAGRLWNDSGTLKISAG